MKPSENAQWLAVEGWCTPEEGDALYEAARSLNRDATIVEIGTYRGRSAIALSLDGRLQDHKVVTIDDDTTPERITAVAATMIAFEFPLIAVVGDSREWASRWEVPITFLYIDGWHDAENVHADYTAWYPHVIDGGSIWFHDAYGAGWPDVQAEIDAILARGECTLEGYVGTIAKLRKRGA